MRCSTVRKRLSDALDRALPSGSKGRLDAHLRTCEACRAYRERLDRIQAGSRLPDDRPRESWAAFERSLNAGLAAAGVPFAARRRWAWAAAAVMVLAVLAAWYVLQRPGTAPVDVWAAADDVLEPLLQAAEAGPDAAGRVDRELSALIEDVTPVPDTEAAVLPAADPLFWEGLSDAELEMIAADLNKKTGLGGPK